MDNRCMLLTPRMNRNLVNGATSLFNDRTKVSEQFRKGLIGNEFFGYDSVYQNTLLKLHTTGTDDGTGDYLTDIAAGEANGSAGEINIDTGAGSFKKGDIVTFASVNAVHAETKQDLGYLKQFVVTADATPGAGGGSLFISPSIISSGARQNVSAAPADGAEVFKRESDDTTAIGNAADYYVGLGFHKDAFAFATADLVMPKGVDFAAREIMDGLSMRIVRQYDINNDNLPCRIDLLYGYKTIRPELAVRLGFN
jgi:hypothetical protein